MTSIVKIHPMELHSPPAKASGGDGATTHDDTHVTLTPEQIALAVEQHYKVHASASGEQSYWWQQRRLQKTMPDGAWYIALFGLAAVISGEFFGYNAGLNAGVGAFLLITALVGFGYVMLAHSMGEMASAIPFCGGSYGFARCVFGKHVGCFVGFIESIEYLFLVATTNYFLAQSVTLMAQTDQKLEPLWYFLVYLFAFVVQVFGTRLKWHWCFFVGWLNVVLIVLYVLCTAPIANMAVNGQISAAETANAKWFTDDTATFFASFPFACWFFIGIEIVPMCSEETKNPRQDVPAGLRRGIYVLVVAAFVVLLSVSAVNTPTQGTVGNSTTIVNIPGDITATASQVYPLNAGWNQAFKVPDSVNPNLVIVLSFFAMQLSGFANLLGGCRQLFAMSRSGYLPTVLSITTSKGVPIVATAFETLLAFLVCIIVSNSFNPPRLFNCLFNISTICGLINYLIQFASFIVFRLKYHQVRREYSSPFGIPGAAIGGAIFAIALATMLTYTPFILDAIYAFLVIQGSLLAYYFFYSRRHLTLSPEEAAALFPVYNIRIRVKAEAETLKPSKRVTVAKSRNSQMPALETSKNPTINTKPAKSPRGNGSSVPAQPHTTETSTATAITIDHHRAQSHGHAQHLAIPGAVAD